MAKNKQQSPNLRYCTLVAITLFEAAAKVATRLWYKRYKQ